MRKAGLLAGLLACASLAPGQSFYDDFTADSLARRPVSRVIGHALDAQHGVHNASLTEAADGSLVAAWTSKERAGTRWLDNSPTNTIQVSRSTDQGQTWSAPVTAVTPSANNASFLRDPKSGEILLIYNWNRSEIPDDTTIAFKRSTDNGRTWGEQTILDTGYPVNIIVHSGIVLSNGDWLIPFHGDRSGQSPPFSMQRVDYPAAVVISTDHGRTWRRYGAVEVPNLLRQPNTSNWAVEPNVAERQDGSLVMILRTRAGRLYQAESTDRGRTWSAAWPMLLSSPDAKTALWARANGSLVLLWNNTSFLPTRYPLLASFSLDGGRTWPHTIPISDDHVQTDYPTVIESKGKIRVVYTRALQEVRLVELSEQDLTRFHWAAINGDQQTIAVRDGRLQFRVERPLDNPRDWLRWTKAVAFRYVQAEEQSLEADFRLDDKTAQTAPDAALGVFAAYQDEGDWTAWVWQPRNAQAGLLRQLHRGAPGAGRAEETVDQRLERTVLEANRWYRLRITRQQGKLSWQVRERESGRLASSGAETVAASGPFLALGVRHLKASFDNVVVTPGVAGEKRP